jgi:hypothetical protein
VKEEKITRRITHPKSKGKRGTWQKVNETRKPDYDGSVRTDVVCGRATLYLLQPVAAQ